MLSINGNDEVVYCWFIQGIILIKKSKQTPKCEICGKAPAEFFWSGENPEREHNDWKFTCVNCCSDFYAFEINNFFESPGEEVNWIWHLIPLCSLTRNSQIGEIR